MLQRGESLGVFQVESRAQMNMLPRLKPRTFYDLVIEVAIVRPGPIQGDMVHPYLKRRNGEEPVVFPAPDPRYGERNELEQILGKTLGVPLFQEQAMRIAIEAAKFTPDEANQLRKAMATFRHNGTIHKFEDKMINKLIERGYPEDFARNCFNQIKGFGEYGFPESHAASFAKLVYVSSWLKHHHPDVFCCALLNSQPMGFYAPAQIVADARKNGVVVREIDVSFSFADNALEETMRQVSCPAARLPPDRRFCLCRSRRLHRPGQEGRRDTKESGERLVEADRRSAQAAAVFLAGGFRTRHRSAEARADPAGRCGCFSLARPRPPRGAVGGAPPAGRHPAAVVHRRVGARAA